MRNSLNNCQEQEFPISFDDDNIPYQEPNINLQQVFLGSVSGQTPSKFMGLD